jgi:hypothetical protein
LMRLENYDEGAMWWWKCDVNEAECIFV